MAMLSGPWMAEENERLIVMVAKRASAVRVAGAFNRTTGSVRTQAIKLGKPFVHHRIVRKKWTTDSKS
jgi:hypothetical protein